MPNRFDLEKTWRASGNGVFTFSSAGNVVFPFGRAAIYVSGKGADGTNNTGGTATSNPITPIAPTGGTPRSNPITPIAPTGGTLNPITPGAPKTGGPTGGTLNPITPIAATGGTPATANPITPIAPTGGTPASNPITSGVAGTPFNVLGVNFPGGSAGPLGPTTAPTIPATEINYYTYPDNATYPVSVPAGSVGVSVKVEID